MVNTLHADLRDPSNLWGVVRDLQKQGWTLTTDRDNEGNLLRARLDHKILGTWYYGQMPGVPWDQWWFEEAGGGGSVSSPYAIDPTGQVYQAVLQIDRPLAGLVLETPRGALQVGKTKRETAISETAGEVGVLVAVENIIELPGPPVNMNSTFFDTRRGGIEFFGYHMSWDALRPAPELQEESLFRNFTGDVFVLRDEIDTTEKGIEKIKGCAFIAAKYKNIAQLSDGFTFSAHVRLMAELGY